MVFLHLYRTIWLHTEDADVAAFFSAHPHKAWITLRGLVKLPASFIKSQSKRKSDQEVTSSSHIYACVQSK